VTARPPSAEDPHRENETLRQENEALCRRLAEAEQANEALTQGQIDAIVDEVHGVLLLLHQAQEALRTSEEKYRTIVTTADEGIWTLDAGARITFANERMASMLGYNMEEMIGHTNEDFVDASAREEILHGFERRRQGVRERRDLPLRRKDGTVLWASVASGPLVDPDGRFTGALGLVTDITEKRRLEEARRSTEERFSLVFRASPIPIAIVTTSSDFLEVNDRYVEFSGYPSEELIGRSARDLGMWAEPADLERFVDAMSREGRVRDFEATFLHKSRETRDVLLSVESIELRDVAEPVRIFMFTDITERKRAEALIVEQHATLKGILESVSDPVFSVDRQYRYRSFNRAHAAVMKALYGTDIQIGHNLAEYQTVPEDWQNARRNLDRALQGESLLESAYSGDEILSRRYFEVVHYPIRTDTEEIIGVSVFSRDITERKLAEAASARFLAGSPAVIYALRLTPDGFRVLWFSENILSLTGYTPAEVQAGDPQHWWEQAIHPDDLPRVVAANQTVLDKGQAMIEFRFHRKDGSWLWVHDEKRVLFDPENRPSEVVGSWMDVTARVRLEEQFLQAQKMEAVGRLAGGIAHDFNNILTVIGGYSEVLLKTLPEGEPAHGHATEIGLAAKRAVALTRQLLAFSRKQVLEPKVLDLNTIVSGMLGLLSRLLGEDVEIVFELQKGLGLVKADPGQIEQVIMNLAVNARDAMPQGGKLILETQDVELDESYALAHMSIAADSYVLLAASDTGCGMTPETASHIFEPFFTTKELGKGTGLGLSTVFGIVKQSGGEISVTSVPGEGATFKIYLPRVGSEIGERDPASSPTIIRARPGETVLMVEDDEVVGRLTQSMLSDLGYDVLTASRGEEALEIAARQPGPIHLLLTDVVMPGLKGPEVATRLLAVHPETRIVFMSGYAAESLLHQTAVLGTAVFLQKPFTSSKLGGKLREALDAVPLPEQQGAGVHGGRKPLSILHMDDDRDILEITRTFLGDDGHRVVSCLDVEETVARYAEALVRAECFDLVLLDLSIPGKKGGVEGMREILALDPTAKIVACSGAGPAEVGPLESGFVGIVEKPFTSESLKAILHLL
jgi:two-component system cell cycle sensor histidine kinase/response regulator CckA